MMVRVLIQFSLALGAIVLSSTDVYASERGWTTGWTIVDSYTLPEDASGLAWDGADLYCGIYGVNGRNIYRINPDTDAYSLAFIAQQEDAFGLIYDGDDFWVSRYYEDPGHLYKLTNTGTIFNDVNGN